MSIYRVTSEEELPSPSEELKDIPFSRISKTITKPTEERGDMIAPRRRNSNNFEDASPSSTNFGSTELNDSSLSSKGKKLEKVSKTSNTGKLNEKYATMQQKMTHMVQEIIYPRDTTLRNSKNSLNNINPTQQMRRDDQSEMENPFLINSSNTSSHTTGNLMDKWLDSNSEKRKFSDLIEDSAEQEISSDKVGRTNKFTRPRTQLRDERHVIKWKNDKLPESFTNCKVNVSSLGSMTPNFHNRQEKYSLKNTPIKKIKTQSAPNTRDEPFSTPHRMQPNFIVRKRARRVTKTWTPKDDQEDEDDLSPSPSPKRSRKSLNKDDILPDNSRYDQPSPTHSETNIYTRQLSQQNLNFSDAARNPIFTDTTIESLDDFFQSANELTDILDF